MKQLFLAATILGFTLFSQTADAQCRKYTRNINQTQVYQKQRIHQGIRSGELTRMEARGLSRQQEKINNYKRMAMADGRISARERAMIRNEQRKANRTIYRQKHDRQGRYYGRN